MPPQPNPPFRSRPRLIGRLVAAGLLLGGAVPATLAAGSRLAFALNDQFNHEHTAAAYAGDVVVLTVTDREGSRYSGAWVGGIQQALPADARAHVRFVSAADLRGVPFFVRGWVRGKFPQDPQAWVLLDWSGSLPKAYDLPGGYCNILIFGRGGRLKLKLAGREVQPADVASAARTIEALVAGAPAPRSE